MSFAVGYLGVSLWALPDVAARGADLAHIPLVTLVGSAAAVLGRGGCGGGRGVHVDRGCCVDAVEYRVGS